jgi:hypothetical protein
MGLKKTPKGREFHGDRILIRIVLIIMALGVAFVFALAQIFWGVALRRPFRSPVMAPATGIVIRTMTRMSRFP